MTPSVPGCFPKIRISRTILNSCGDMIDGETDAIDILRSFVRASIDAAKMAEAANQRAQEVSPHSGPLPSPGHSMEDTGR